MQENEKHNSCCYSIAAEGDSLHMSETSKFP